MTELPRLIAKAFGKMSDSFKDVENGQAMNHLVRNLDMQKLKNMVSKWENDHGCIFLLDYPLDWSDYLIPDDVRSALAHDFTFWTDQNPNSGFPPTLIPENRRGRVRIKSWRVDSIAIFPKNADSATFRFKYNLPLEIQAHVHHRNTTHQKPESDPSDWFFIDNWRHHYWSEPLIIPLRILACWMKGDIVDPSTGVRAELSSGQWIKYDSKWYPLAICELFQALGWKAFNYFVKLGYLTKENSRIILYNLELLGYSFEAEEIGGTAQDTIQNNEPSTISMPASISECMEAYQLRSEDVERLRKTDKYSGVFPSTRTWVKVLGLTSSSGPSAFFTRMEEKDLIITLKGPGGLGVSAKLTDKARRILKVL